MAGVKRGLREYMQHEDAVPHLAPWRALVLYLVVGLLWFGAGDAIMPQLVQDRALYLLLQQGQDYVFVLLSGCYAAWLVLRTMRAEARRSADRQALEASEEKLRLALDGSGSGMWDWDMAQRRHTFSQGVAKLMRYEGCNFSAEFRFKPRIHPDDRAMVGQAAQATLEQGVPFVVTARVLCFDGAYRWFEARGTRHLDDRGQPVTVEVTTQPDGTYAAPSLRPGPYTVTQPNQPVNSANGITTPGSAGGTATTPATTPSAIAPISLTMPGSSSAAVAGARSEGIRTGLRWGPSG
jgi:PAS domain-containing protein